MKNKKLIIILGAVIIIVLLLFIFINKDNSVKVGNDSNKTIQVYEPKFLSNEEKIKMDLNTELPIQVLKRNSEGEVSVYKIIRKDKDIVTDPLTVKPISPRTR